MNSGVYLKNTDKALLNLQKEVIPMGLQRPYSPQLALGMNMNSGWTTREEGRMSKSNHTAGMSGCQRGAKREQVYISQRAFVPSPPTKGVVPKLCPAMLCISFNREMHSWSRDGHPSLKSLDRLCRPQMELFHLYKAIPDERRITASRASQPSACPAIHHLRITTDKIALLLGTVSEGSAGSQAGARGSILEWVRKGRPN
ncbi:hypothetical protein DFP72DRAFT_1103933 [Ephemerocybe angulata]|uniref:Uncharacterized protein n=1 Tax=Ephemerocybe angulata TaxID=980116 RepID=A0A8H6I4S7_9AGAR|nr:hypothetical protein DFP72DRAFT_1103933 [Tulosesus angulatus]